MKKPERTDYNKPGVHKKDANRKYFTELANWKHANESQQLYSKKVNINEVKMEIEKQPNLLQNNPTTPPPHHKKAILQDINTIEFQHALIEEIPSTNKIDPEFEIPLINDLKNNDFDTPTGNRVINIHNLFIFIKEISDHIMICNYPLKYGMETQNGLQSLFNW